MRWRRLERLARLRRLRLSHALLLLLVPALLLLALVELQLTAREVRRAANAAYDRSLLGALKAIDANISTESGGLSIELPYRMLEFFELTASGPVHFRVATSDGLVELGSADLPMPPQGLQAQVPVFYDGTYFGEPVRMVAYLRDVAPRTGQVAGLAPGQAPQEARQLVVQVAESTRARREFSQGLIRRTALGNLLFLCLTIGVAVLAVVFVLRPLSGVSAAMARRSSSDLQPVDLDSLPADVRPLMAAMNQHMRRIQALMAQQREFLDDASHQLRTHLTTLQMQVDYARGESEPAQARVALDALALELQRATRSTQQLLSLGRSDSAALELSAFDLAPLLREVARALLGQARARGIDLGVDSPANPVRGDRELLREALTNLAANAVRHARGMVTLSSAQDGQGFSFSVEDDGPGLPAPLRERQGTRFMRGAGASPAGTGLGLAIAQAIAGRHGGVLRLEPPGGGTGLRASLWWPRPGEGKAKGEDRGEDGGEGG